MQEGNGFFLGGGGENHNWGLTSLSYMAIKMMLSSKHAASASRWMRSSGGWG